MPLPKPKKGESKDDFISRCLSNNTVKKEFESQEQRSGYCYGAWEESVSKENAEKVLRRVNFSDAGVEQKLDIAPDQIPTLVKNEILAKWQEGDDKPFYKLQKIEYPIKANGLIYEESFFESFLNKLPERPIPGSKSGHNMFWSERPATDFLLVGGKIESNGDGTGNVYFKNYIPPRGESGDNSVFIRENESDMVHYSLVTYPKEIIESDEDGTKIRIVESMFGERNDAVEWGTGAMRQLTNKADEQDENNAADSDVKRITNEEIKVMDKNELLQRLNVLRQNGDITLLEIASSMGLESQIVTDEAKSALETVSRFNKAGIKDIDGEFKRLQERAAEADKAKRENELLEEFGARKNSDGSVNVVRQYAEQRYNGETTIEKIKEDEVFKQLQAQQADYTSETNQVGVVEGGGNDKKKDNGPTVVEY